MATNKRTNPLPHDFVTEVVQDPKAPPNVLVLSGFPGPSSEEGHTRLYFDVLLSDYVEIPDPAILHRLDKQAELSPLGGSLLWIERDAELIHGQAQGSRSKARFLEGRLTQAYPDAASHNPPCPQPSEQAGETPKGAQKMYQNVGPTGWFTCTVPTVPACPTPTAQPTHVGCQPTWGCPPAVGGYTLSVCPTQTAQPTYAGCVAAYTSPPPPARPAAPAAAPQPDLVKTFAPYCVPATYSPFGCPDATQAVAPQPGTVIPPTFGCPNATQAAAPQPGVINATRICPYETQAAAPQPGVLVSYPPYCAPATVFGCSDATQAAAQQPGVYTIPWCPPPTDVTLGCQQVAQAAVAPQPNLVPTGVGCSTGCPTVFCPDVAAAPAPAALPTLSPPTCPVCPPTVGCPAGG